MESVPLLRYLLFGQLSRDTILPLEGKPQVDIPGGSLFYSAAGLALWGNSCGLVGRVGEDYPQDWLTLFDRRQLDRRGVRTLPEALDVRAFYAYLDENTCQRDNPVSHFARLGEPFPKSLLGYANPTNSLDSRTQAAKLSLRMNDIPEDYLDATAAHLCPLDFISHSMIPPALRRGQMTTITLDPGEGYMNPIFWDDIPALVKGLSAFICSETKLANLFLGRSTDPWEMAEAIANYGCEFVVIKRGARGQYLYDSVSRVGWQLPAYPSKIVDPTGAGDAFSGGFLATLRETYDPLEAVLRGGVSASLVLEGSGPFYALDTLPGLPQARLESLRGMVRRR
ncbi:carbohydrate kinase family protein [bacterium]|nr:MAG: carbohydrate kinase family protein [bacterium]